MTMSGIAINTPVPTTANKFLGNGRELQDDFSVDPNYFSTYFREYDPVLGRFNGIDPLAANFDVYSPYHYAYNDPVNFSDPTGAEPEHFEEQMNIYDYYPWMDPSLDPDVAYRMWWNSVSPMYRDSGLTPGEEWWYSTFGHIDDGQGIWGPYGRKDYIKHTDEYGRVSKIDPESISVQYKIKNLYRNTPDLSGSVEISSITLDFSGAKSLDPNIPDKKEKTEESHAGFFIPAIAVAEEILISLGVVATTTYHANSKKNRQRNYLYEIRSFSLVDGVESYQTQKYGISSGNGERVRYQVNFLNKQYPHLRFEYIIHNNDIPGRLEALILEEFYVTMYRIRNLGDAPPMQKRPIGYYID